MTPEPEHVTRARTIMGELAAAEALVPELQALNTTLMQLAAKQAESAVATLSLLPLMASDPRALDFLADVVAADSATIQGLLGAQATLGRILDRLDARLVQLDAAVSEIRNAARVATS